MVLNWTPAFVIVAAAAFAVDVALLLPAGVTVGLPLVVVSVVMLAEVDIEAEVAGVSVTTPVAVARMDCASTPPPRVEVQFLEPGCVASAPALWLPSPAIVVMPETSSEYELPVSPPFVAS